MPLLCLLLPVVLATTVVLGGCSGEASEPGSERAQRSPTEADTPPQPRLSYVALGDSFTAAPGVPETDTSDGCLRSSRNYPSLVADRLEEDFDVDLTDRSCSAADTTSLLNEQVVARDALAPQLDAVDRRTDLVTLSMGGNDFGVFLTLVGGCLGLAREDPEGSPCQDAAAAQGDALAETQRQIEQRLVDAVAEIEHRAPRAQVLLVGYPQLAPRVQGCPQLPLARGDLPFAREVNKSLTDNLAGAADRTGTTYVDVWAASAGHDICASEPWVNGQAGQASGAIPFHPLPAGQRGVAETVLEAIEPPPATR